MRKKVLLILTPFIITAYPVLYMLSANVELVDFSDIVLSLLFYQGVTLAILLVLRKTFGNIERTVFMTSVVVIIFFTYGHIFALIDAPWGHWLLIPLALMAVGLAVRLSSRKRIWLPEMIRSMGLAFGGLLLVAVGSVIYYGLTVNTAKGLTLDGALGVLGLSEIDLSVVDPEMLEYDIPLEIEDASALPDIYYIILDEYANSNTLMQMHGFDNAPFLDALRQRDFFVAEDSRTNYPATFLSLASSLNMDYMNFLSGQDLDYRIVYHLIDHNRVSAILRNAGYQIVYFPSIYYVTNGMESADITYRIEREVPLLGVEYSNFDLVLFNSTLVGSLLDGPEDYDILDDYRETTLYALENLRLIPEIDGPTFTFAHLTVPHRPYVFTVDDDPALTDDAAVDGRVVAEGTYAPYTDESNIPAYLDQINYVNRAIVDLVDDILATSDNPPIIIIQSDHGHRMQGEPGADDWGPAEIYEYVFPILNSYHLPGYDGVIQPDITPVNTFRLIFDHYFGTDLGLIEERSYYPEDYFSYDFLEVTDGNIREVPPAPAVEE